MLPFPDSAATSEPQMPLRIGRTRTHSAVGRRGSGIWVILRNAPGAVSILGNRPPRSLAQTYRATLFLYCNASIYRPSNRMA